MTITPGVDAQIVKLSKISQHQKLDIISMVLGKDRNKWNFIFPISFMGRVEAQPPIIGLFLVSLLLSLLTYGEVLRIVVGKGTL